MLIHRALRLPRPVSLTLLLIATACLVSQAQTSQTQLQVVHSFSGIGSYKSPVVQTADGALYGVTVREGVFGEGMIYRVSGAGFAMLHSFSGSDGRRPTGIMRAADGNFYGMTNSGGSADFGVVFRSTTLLDDVWTVSVLHTFGPDDPGGVLPQAGLIQAYDGMLYGTTEFGPRFPDGKWGNGAVIRLAADGTGYSVPHVFSDPGYPFQGVIQALDGSFYGTAAWSSKSSNGAVYRLAADGTFAAFPIPAESSSSLTPFPTVIQGADGDFYGTVSYGDSQLGRIFRMARDGSAFTILHRFNGTDGSNPHAALVQGTDGNFYGTTLTGGAYGNGTVFRMTPAGEFLVLQSFNGANGANPDSPLIQGADGNFYGTTRGGGAAAGGVLFRLIVRPDTTPPLIASVTATPDTLWPADHRMVAVSIAVSVSDAEDPAPACAIADVTSSEPVEGQRDGDLSPDWFVTGALTLDLRAERLATGNGRLYTITVRCADASSNASTNSVVVTVPRDMHP